MCANVHYESVYFKELHNDQEYYWLTIYPAGAAVVSTITSLHFEEYLQEKTGVYNLIMKLCRKIGQSLAEFNN